MYGRILIGRLFIILVFIPAISIIYAPFRHTQDRVKKQKQMGKEKKRHKYLEGFVVILQALLTIALVGIVLVNL